jgi:hypothetical protein
LAWLISMDGTEGLFRGRKLSRRQFLTIGCGTLTGGAGACLLAPA